VNKQEQMRLRRAHDNAILREEDLRVSINDWKRELASADPDYQPRKVALLTAQLEDLKGQLKEVQEEADKLRVQIRELGIPEAEPVHPGGAAAAIIERDKRPTQWNQGGDIRDRDSAWEAPEIKRTR
jgi:hypothetical protein